MLRDEVAIVCALALVVASCAGIASGLRVRAANDLQCPEAAIEVTEGELGAYTASGCGRSAGYVCSTQGQRVCVREGEARETGGTSPAAACSVTSGTGIDIARAQASMRNAAPSALRCAGAERVTLRISVSADGAIDGLELDATVTEVFRACVAPALADIHVDGVTAPARVECGLWMERIPPPPPAAPAAPAAPTAPTAPPAAEPAPSTTT